VGVVELIQIPVFQQTFSIRIHEDLRR